MKKSPWIIAALLATAGAVAAAGPVPLNVAVADLSAAGIVGAVAVAPIEDRFGAPVYYFRINEALSASDAKKDCADCANLVAVYAVDSPIVPGWAAEPKMQFLKVGGRLQLRTYLADKKRIVTVTAPSETTARKITAELVRKFSK